MKQRIPWPFKVAMKLAFGVLHVDYRWLKKRGLVEHGRMEEEGFARSIFQRHVTDALGGAAPRGCLVEIGPGDSIATGFLARAAGFDSALLVDAGEFAALDPERLDHQRVALAPMLAPFEISATRAQVVERLARDGIRYETSGVRAFERVASGSVHHSFSNTVLQHVHRADLPRLLAELGRVHAQGSLSSHLIKFNDHFSGGFLNKRLPDGVMESDLVKRANLYTNRVDADAFGNWFEDAGLSIVRVSVDYARAGRASVEVKDLAQLRAVAADQLMRAMFVLRKG
jgi:hypothetical protein